jgi:hypothetical protein
MKCLVIQETQHFKTEGGLPQPELVSVRRFRADLGIVPSTLWRWIQRRWLDQPIDIGGRKYLTSEMVRRFKERAARGEFAGKTKPPRSKSLAEVAPSEAPKIPVTRREGGEGVGIAGGSPQVPSIVTGKF